LNVGVGAKSVLVSGAIVVVVEDLCLNAPEKAGAKPMKAAAKLYGCFILELSAY
jgi:hypothetical protein